MDTVSEKSPILADDARLALSESFVADVMIVDPPYRAHVHKNTTSQDQRNGGGVRHNDLGFESRTTDMMSWLCRMAARMRRWSIIYTDIESVGDWKRELELAGATYIRTVPWVRWSIPQLSGDRPPQGFECLVVAHGSDKGRKHWNGAGNLTHLAHAMGDWGNADELLSYIATHGDLDGLTHISHLALRGNGKHKTEKPLDQLLDLVSWFSDPNEMVIDPCSGSGTTGLACKILGRNFMGCELDAEWVEKGNARIQSCDVDKLPGSLSPRDGERYSRWIASSEKEKTDAVGRKENTGRVRARLADKKLSLVSATQKNDLQKEEAVVSMPQTWTEAYEQCLAECSLKSPKTPAADRTLPLFMLFEDEYAAGAWKAAYERALAELVPSLSPVLLAKIAEKKKASAAVAPCGYDLGGEGRTCALPHEHHGPHQTAQSIAAVAVPDTFPGEPPLSLLVDALRERGCHVSLVDIAGWSVIKRDVARAWIDQGGEQPEWLAHGWIVAQSAPDAVSIAAHGPDVVPDVVRPGVVCQACNGTGYNMTRTAKCSACDGCGQANAARWQVPKNGSSVAGFYDPTKLCSVCQGGGCDAGGEDCSACAGSGHPLLPDRMVETPVQTAAPTPEPAKRGKGRPPGVKNKMPKAWKLAHTRVMTELGVS